MRRRRDSTGQHVFCLPRKGRQPLIGDQHDLSPPRRRVARERDDVVLITPDVEYDQNVASSYVEQTVAPNANS